MVVEGATSGNKSSRLVHKTRTVTERCLRKETSDQRNVVEDVVDFLRDLSGLSNCIDECKTITFYMKVLVVLF